VNAPLPNLVDGLVAEFRRRAETLARLYAAGKLSLQDAVDRAQQSAEAFGLLLPVGGIGQDEVQRLMAESFAAVPSEGAPAVDAVPEVEKPSDQYEGLSSTFAVFCHAADTKRARKTIDPRLNKRAPGEMPNATLQAAEYLVREKDPARMRAWLDRHTAQEREAILQQLERRGGVK
jgi:hypothetical protein